MLNCAYFFGLRLELPAMAHPKICCPLPFFHAYPAILSNVMTPIHTSTLVVPGEGFSAEETLNAMQNERYDAVEAIGSAS